MDPKQKHEPLDSFLKKYWFIYPVVLDLSQGKQDLCCQCSMQDLLVQHVGVYFPNQGSNPVPWLVSVEF